MDKIELAVLYCVGVLQPVAEHELLEAAEQLVTKLNISASVDDLKRALNQARKDRQIWYLGNHMFSLTLLGHGMLKIFRMNKSRDKERLKRLKERARG
jgi:hypothetical protein